jgi:hypothetical protein
MKTTCRLLVIGWLASALLVLWLDGRLDDFALWIVPGSVAVLVVVGVVRWQLAPSRYNRPPLPERYRVADDLDVPLCVVVAVAEHEAAP